VRIEDFTWHDLDPYWGKIVEAAKGRERNWASTRIYSEHYEVVGCAGEQTAGLECGLEATLPIVPDPGRDFPFTDVKGTAGLPRLIVPPKKLDPKELLKSGVLYFALAIIDLGRRLGRIAGWATPEDLRPHVDANFRDGPKHVLWATELPHRYCLPPVLYTCARGKKNGGFDA
jgi:hypothetical protein